MDNNFLERLRPEELDALIKGAFPIRVKMTVKEFDKLCKKYGIKSVYKEVIFPDRMKVDNTK